MPSKPMHQDRRWLLCTDEEQEVLRRVNLVACCSKTALQGGPIDTVAIHDDHVSYNSHSLAFSTGNGLNMPYAGVVVATSDAGACSIPAMESSRPEPLSIKSIKCWAKRAAGAPSMRS